MTSSTLFPPALRRRRRLLVGLAVLLAVRAALPVVVRRVLVTRASEALQHARVMIGDVDLALWRGGIALKNVAVRPRVAVTAGDEPLVKWKRFAISVRWLPLFRHTVRLRSIELDGPRVGVTRLADGSLNFAALMPPAAPEPTPPPEPSPPSQWRVGADRILLRDGQIGFRDLTITDHDPIAFGIDSLEVTGVSMRPDVYPDPGHVRLEAKVAGGGRLHADARLTPRDTGMVMAVTLGVRSVPVQRSRFYVPDVGWSELEGRLDAALKYRHEPAVRDRVYGSIALASLAVHVPGFDEPALGWKRLAVRLAPLDLLARRAVVAAVTLDGATLLVRPQGGDLLPVLARAGQRAAAPPAPEPEPKAEGKPGPPWRWAVGSLRVADAHVKLLGADAPVDVGVGVGAHDLAGDAGKVAPVELTLGVGDGSVQTHGQLRLAPPGFAGRVQADKLALPELVAAAGVLPPELLQAGILDGDLAVEAGLAGEGGAGVGEHDVRVRGTLAVTKPWIAAHDPNDFAVGGGAVKLALTEVSLPGALGGAAPGARTVQLGELRLDAPVVRLTRAPEGFVLPSFAPPPRAGSDTARPPPPPAEPAAAPALALAVDALVIGEGQVRVVDRTVTPFYEGDLWQLTADGHGLRWPPPALERLRLTADTGEKGRLEVRGGYTGQKATLEVNGKDIALTPFNPYATTYSGYSVGSGRLSVETKASYDAGRYRAGTSVTLHRLGLRASSGESLFQQYFGIPIEMALALMRDVRGDIKLDVPVQGDAKGTQVDLMAIVGGALRNAIVNALASPLKLAGAVFGGEGGGESLAPAPIAFPPGRAQLAPEGEQQVAQLARLLAGRPGVGVALDGTPSAADVRWLREQALREELDSAGVLGTLRSLPQRGTREAIRKALAQRATGGEGKLSADDAATLDQWLAERPPLPPDRVARLADERVARVTSQLHDRHGVEPARISRTAAAGEPRADGPPGVKIALTAVGG